MRRIQGIIALTLLCGACHVTGFGSYRTELPNGERVPHPCKPNYFWKGVGHGNEEGGGSRNQFGLDFAANGHQWTQALCSADSDGDGMTNGQELGDPGCTWTKGSIPTNFDGITHPGVCTPYNTTQCAGKNDWVDCQSTPMLDCPAIQNPDTQNITLRFPRVAVPAKETTYMCMVFDIPSDQDYHMIAYKPEIDNDNVMHHIVIYGCEESDTAAPTAPYECDMGAGYKCNLMIGGWTLGGAGNCFHEQMGILFGKSKYKRFALEFHWNNPQLVDSWHDSSGMTIYYTQNRRPNNGGIISLGQNFLEIPPGKERTTFTSKCSSDCTGAALNGPIQVTGAINHMHYLGNAQFLELRRNGTRVRYITNEPEFSYDDPTFYTFDTPITVLPNDELITTCEYKSTYSKKWVHYGDATSDEMCFTFLIFYPVEAMPDPYCTSWKSVDVCALGTKPLVVDGCNAFGFVFGSDPASAEVIDEVNENCFLGGTCHDDCKHAVMRAKAHPCMKEGDIKHYVTDMMQRNKDGLSFLRRMDMCVITKDDYNYPNVGVGTAGSTVTVLAVAMAVLV
ncbi:uncharacterized protein LOC124143521 [Haliotis rufescens]|uniref:uncharacterized protein LOC124143521 n=1 Tax=Haliotis rufescens TaxID=6454 RepID=UPI00201F7975|nr:uncharacterized protein LOC124143521 [Haliotis rufescens]